MNKKNFFHKKVFFFSLVTFLIIFISSISYGYEWTKTFGGSEGDWANAVRQTTDGGYIITGFTSSFGAGLSDIYLIKTDANGNELWSRTFGGGGRDEGFSVHQTTEGGYIIAGATEPSWGGFSNSDVYIIKTDVNGNELWSRTFGGSSYDAGHYVQQTTDNGYIISATTWSIAGNFDIYLIQHFGHFL